MKGKSHITNTLEIFNTMCVLNSFLFCGCFVDSSVLVVWCWCFEGIPSSTNENILYSSFKYLENILYLWLVWSFFAVCNLYMSFTLHNFNETISLWMVHGMNNATSLIYLKYSLLCALWIILCFVYGLQFLLCYKLYIYIYMFTGTLTFHNIIYYWNRFVLTF